MLILKRKRIIVMMCMFFLALYAFSFKIANEELIINKKTIETVSTSVTDKIVIIDAGHGTPDEGGSLLHQVKNRSNYFFIKNNCRCKSLQFF